MEPNEALRLWANKVTALEAQNDVLQIVMAHVLAALPPSTRTALQRTLPTALTAASASAQESSWEYGVAVDTTVSRLLSALQA